MNASRPIKAAKLMAPPPASSIISIWECDICQDAVFENYDDAVAHETQCTGGKLSLDTIRTVWPSLEAYLDLSEVVNLSKSCKALHQDIIDGDTGKVKILQFRTWWDMDLQTGNFSQTDMAEALNCIHFPSLKILDVQFSMISTEEGEDTTYQYCLSILAYNLAFARNLEEFNLEIMEAKKTPKVVFRHLGKNLERCSKLKNYLSEIVVS